MRSSIRKLALVAASAAFLIAAGTSAQAQTSASAPAVATAATSDAKPLTKAEQRKQRRAQSVVRNTRLPARPPARKTTLN